MKNLDPKLVVPFSLTLFCCLRTFPAAREALLLLLVLGRRGARQRRRGAGSARYWDGPQRDPGMICRGGTCRRRSGRSWLGAEELLGSVMDLSAEVLLGRPWIYGRRSCSGQIDIFVCKMNILNGWRDYLCFHVFGWNLKYYSYVWYMPIFFVSWFTYHWHIGDSPVVIHVIPGE
jgi:hypothetical protein